MITPIDGSNSARIVDALEPVVTATRELLTELGSRAESAPDETFALVARARRTVDGSLTAFDATDWPAARAVAELRALDDVLGSIGASHGEDAVRRATGPLRDALGGVRLAERLVRLDAHDRAVVATSSMPAWSASVVPTLEESRAELARLVSIDNASLADDEIRRIALIGGLPDDVRPSIDATRSEKSAFAHQATFDDLAERHRSHSSMRYDVEAGLNRSRLAILVPDLAADATVDHARSVDRIADVLVRPNDELSTDHVRELAMVASLPASRRGSIPDDAVDWITRTYVGGFRPRTDFVTFTRFQDLRTTLFDLEPDVMLRHVGSRVAAGERVSSDVLARLVDVDDAALAGAGLSRERLLAAILSAVGDGGVENIGWGRDLLVSGRRLVGMLEVAPEHRQLAAAIESDIDDALTAVERRFGDGPERTRLTRLGLEAPPEFSGIGRAASTATLLDSLRGASSRATAGAEQLAW